MKKRKYWAGYVEDKIDSLNMDETTKYVLSVFRTRKIARKHYQDVRPVYIVPAKASRKKAQ